MCMFSGIYCEPLCTSHWYNKSQMFTLAYTSIRWHLSHVTRCYLPYLRQSFSTPNTNNSKLLTHTENSWYGLQGESELRLSLTVAKNSPVTYVFFFNDFGEWDEINKKKQSQISAHTKKVHKLVLWIWYKPTIGTAETLIYQHNFFIA